MIILKAKEKMIKKLSSETMSYRWEREYLLQGKMGDDWGGGGEGRDRHDCFE